MTTVTAVLNTPVAIMVREWVTLIKRFHYERNPVAGPVLPLLLLVMLSVTACDVSSMAFVRDDRVRIETPEDRGTVTLPVTVRWDVHDFEITGRNGEGQRAAGYFAVFVDRPPILPGTTLEWYATQEESCGGAACGTVDNLAHVYVTETTSVTFDQLPADRKKRDLERHEAVIVLMDGTGARIGESAFSVRFNFERVG